VREKLVSQLRTLRLGRNLTIRDLRNLTGISTGRISMLERGFVLPTERERERLCAAFETNPDELFRMH
jgi:transcriptional regulator with XRE-family HTH domain